MPKKKEKPKPLGPAITDEWQATGHQTLYQAICNGDCELIHILHSCNDEPDLSAPNEMENTPAYLAVLFDRPEVLKTLHELGVDLGVFCDPEGYGTPAYYAAYHGRVEVLDELWRLGYKLSDVPANKYDEPLERFIRMYNLPETIDAMMAILSKEEEAALRLQAISRSMAERKKFKAAQKGATCMQARLRGMQDRRELARQRKEAESAVAESGVVDNLQLDEPEPTAESLLSKEDVAKAQLEKRAKELEDSKDALGLSDHDSQSLASK